MIKFVAKTLPRSNNEQDFNDLWNKQALDFADYYSQANKTSKCEAHPDFINLVTVIAKPKGFSVEKTRFCCPDFSNKFTFDNEIKK